MNWKDLISSNFSRKAEIVFITIAALVYVATSKPTEGQMVDKQVILWALLSISMVGLVGITAQTLLDWRWPKHYADKAKGGTSEKTQSSIVNNQESIQKGDQP